LERAKELNRDMVTEICIEGMKPCAAEIGLPGTEAENGGE